MNAGNIVQPASLMIVTYIGIQTSDARHPTAGNYTRHLLSGAVHTHKPHAL